MQTHFLFDVLEGYKPFEQMVQESQKSGAVIAASGMAGAQKAHAACALAARTGRPLLFLCDSERSAAQTMEDLSALLGGGVSLLPAREITFYQDVAASREVAYRRIEAMRKVLSGDARAIVAPADALLHRMMPREVFNRNTISLRVGDVTPIDQLIERLLAAGYTREYMVEGKGQFSVRGGIIDVYPADALSAVRIEFFDDELDSIRAVDVMSQRSQGNMQEVVIPPASEAPVPQEGTEELARLLLEALARQEAAAQKGGVQKDDEASLADLPLEDGEIAAPEVFTRENRTMERFGEKLRAAVGQMQNGVSNRVLEKFINLLYGQTETILDYMNRPIVVLDEPEALFARMDSRTGEFDQAITAALERGEALPEQQNLMLTQDEALAAMRQTTVLALTTILRPVEKLKPTLLAQMGGMGAGNYGGRTHDMCADFIRWQQDGWRILVLSGGTARGERMRQSFEDEGVKATFDELGSGCAAKRRMPHLSADAFRRLSVSGNQSRRHRKRRRIRREERQRQAKEAAGEQDCLLHRPQCRRLCSARDARHRHLSGHKAADQRRREPRLFAGAVSGQRQAVYPGGSSRPHSEIHRRRRERRAQALAAGRQGLG